MIIENKTCPICSDIVLPSRFGFGQSKKYCSENCRAKADRRRSYERRRSMIETFSVTCDICGNEFSTANKTKTWCSSECNAVKHQRKRRDTMLAIANSNPASCIICGGPTKRAAHSGRAFKYCSNECRVRARNKSGPTPISKACEQCGEEFETRIVNKIYCGRECRHQAEHSRRRTERGANTHDRRCRKFHRQYTPIDPHSIFNRDEWVCKICFAPVDQDTVFPDPLSATLDHIVPLSRGGDHIASNLRTAHWGCNIAKRDKLDGEM